MKNDGREYIKSWKGVPATKRERATMFAKTRVGGFNAPSGKVELLSSLSKKAGEDPLPCYKENQEWRRNAPVVNCASRPAPFGAPQFIPEKNIVQMCDLCVERIDQGLLPACVHHCPTGALIFGDPNLLSEQIRQRRAESIRRERCSANNLRSVS